MKTLYLKYCDYNCKPDMVSGLCQKTLMTSLTDTVTCHSGCCMCQKTLMTPLTDTVTCHSGCCMCQKTLMTPLTDTVTCHSGCCMCQKTLMTSLTDPVTSHSGCCLFSLVNKQRISICSVLFTFVVLYCEL